MRVLCLLGITPLLIISALAGLSLQPDRAEAFPSTLRLPFASGQAWYVCQGYNGRPSHTGDPALDLTTYSGRGSNGCWGGANDANGKPVYAPASGQLVNLGGGLGGICITFDAGGSMYFGHLASRRSTGRVSVGQKIGVVAAAGSEGNGGYAHLHLSARTGTGCGGTKVPFDDVHRARFSGAPNMTMPGVANQWAGTKLLRKAPSSLRHSAPSATDYNGDGKSDIFWCNHPGSAKDSIWLATGGGKFKTGVSAAVKGSNYTPIPGDFNGDGKTDIFWFN